MKLPQHDYYHVFQHWEEHDDVEYVERDERIYLQSEKVPWGTITVKALEVSDEHISNQKVCIIDSGYDINHPDLPSSSSIVTGDSQISSESWMEDGHGHGTHVAGTIAGIGGNDEGIKGLIHNGQLKLHIVKIFNNNGDFTHTSDMIQALESCVAAGSTVVNMSFGGEFFSAAANATIDRISKGRVLLVAASGNLGNGGKMYPASYPSVISVGAIDNNNNLAWFSQYNDQVDLVAPGVGILSTVPGGKYAFQQGTSMAAPHVAGVAALLWSNFNDKSAQEIRSAIESTAKDLGEMGRDDKFGHGLVQADRAYDCLAGGDCSSDVTNTFTCEDSPVGWYDIDGPEFDCDFYAQEDNCALYENHFMNQGKTANQACCGCGGGVRTFYSESPSVGPTMSPSSSDHSTKSPSIHSSTKRPSAQSSTKRPSTHSTKEPFNRNRQ